MNISAPAGHLGDTLPAELTADLPGCSLSSEVKASIQVLVVDDDRTLLESCTSVLDSEGYTCATARTAEEALALVARRKFDVALLDLYLPDSSGLELLVRLRAKLPNVLPIVITGRPSVERGIESIRSGAWEFLPKPFSAMQLSILLGRATYRISAERQLEGRAAQLTETGGPGGQTALLGVSRGFRLAVETALRAASTDASVFITGESGTGKELIARLIHEQSPRARRAFVPINCSALPETLLESEMFGYRKGAFTGAMRDKKGLLEVAHLGTMFMDELAEMSPALQTKLLRVIQDGAVRRLGSEGEDVLVDVRFISATNRDPEDALEEGQLRPDLYYRLRVVPIHLPPLRQRPEDIPALANHFLSHYWLRHRGPGAEPPCFEDSALDLLERQRWPGNVRELQNVIEHLTVFVDPGATVMPDDIPLPENERRSSERAAGPIPLGPFHEAKGQYIEQFERQYLANLVSRTAGNMSEAARRAGVDRTTLYRLMYKYGLSRTALMGAR